MQNLLLQGLSKKEVEEMISIAVQTALEKFTALSNSLNKKDNSTAMLSKKEAAKYLRISSPTLLKYINGGYIKAHSVAGTRMRFRTADLDKALVELRSHFKLDKQ